MKSIYMKFIRYLLVVLFLYASVSKLTVHTLFFSQLEQSPLIPINFTYIISYALPILEIVIAILLINKNSLFLGYISSFVLMLLFTVYLIALVSLYNRIPCACGGILGNMSYTVHITFNILVSIMIYFAIKFYAEENTIHEIS